MATPKVVRDVAASLIKNTLSLSPRNPVHLEVPSPKFLRPTENQFRSPNSRKCLNFSGEKTLESGNLHVYQQNRAERDRKECITINTPTKLDLMKNGFNSRGRIVDILGRGAFGTVVKGYYKNSLVAAKINKNNGDKINPSDSNALGLHHKNIVQILDIIMKTESEYSIIIMEYYEGARNLQSFIDSGHHLNEKNKKNIIEQICLGLQYCHNKGVLHLDLKPKNILALPDHQYKICDFGNSCRIEKTRNYVFQGTIAYAAPEILKGKEPTEKCDIYSLGITIWQLEYMKNPYENWSSSNCLLYHVVKNRVRPECPTKKGDIRKLFESCWSENPLCRPGLEEILKMI